MLATYKALWAPSCRNKTDFLAILLTLSNYFESRIFFFKLISTSIQHTILC